MNRDLVDLNARNGNIDIVACMFAGHCFAIYTFEVNMVMMVMVFSAGFTTDSIIAFIVFLKSFMDDTLFF